MRVEDIGAIVPMGLMVDSHVTPVDHIYFEPLVFRSTPYQYGVFAPADGWVVSVGVRNNHVSEAGGVLEVPQYRMVIEYSCHLYTIYDLITRLAPEIEAQMGTNPGYTVMRVPVRAGQEVGRIGGQTLDMNVVDLDVQVGGFAAPEHYVREPWKIHSVDPFDYFVEPLRSQLLALNPRQASPRGGRIGYDVPGRLVGNWFAEGTNGYAGADPTRYWAGHLSIVYDLYDPSQVRVSIGTFEGRSRQFGVRGNGPDPALVDASSGLVVYELVEWEYLVAGTSERWDRLSPQPSGIAAQNGEQVAGVLLAQVQADGTLLVEALPGVSAAQVSGFSSAAQRYER
jgi:hypothetical protein